MNEVQFFMPPAVRERPPLSLPTIEAFVREHYGIDARATRLTSERDENFWMRIENGPGYVLKVANAIEPPSVTMLQIAALLHVERTDAQLPCPRVIPSRSGRHQIRFESGHREVCSALLYTFLPGKPLLEAARSSRQRVTCGHLLARLGRALRDFEHAASGRTLVWDLRHLPKIRALLPHVPGLRHAAFFDTFLAKFDSDVAPRLATLRCQVIHNDFNARNLIVDPQDESSVTGIIDFGDTVHTALVVDVAVGVIGQLASPETAEEAMGEFVHAYCEVEPLMESELDLLNWLVAGRIVQNVVITSWHRAREPSGGHFDGFDEAYFEWRVELAQRLLTRPALLSP